MWLIVHEHVEFNNSAVLSNTLLYGLGNANYSLRSVLNPVTLTNITACPSIDYYWAVGLGCYLNARMFTVLNTTMGIVSIRQLIGSAHRNIII